MDSPDHQSQQDAETGNGIFPRKSDGRTNFFKKLPKVASKSPRWVDSRIIKPGITHVASAKNCGGIGDPFWVGAPVGSGESHPVEETGSKNSVGGGGDGRLTTKNVGGNWRGCNFCAE